jgi:hypothetical protein
MTKRLVTFSYRKNEPEPHASQSMWDYINEQLLFAKEFGDKNVRKAIAVGIAQHCQAMNWDLEDLLILFTDRATALQKPHVLNARPHKRYDQ